MDERAEFARFMEHMEKGLKREAPTLTREEMLAVVAFSLWQENRRTTPDREAIIEECAKVAEQRSLMLASDSDMTRGYANGRLGAAADIRALKTAPTSDKGGA